MRYLIDKSTLSKSGSSILNPLKRKNFEEQLKREQFKGSLIYKFLIKYMKNQTVQDILENSQNFQFIQQQVQEYIKDNKNVTQNTLKILEETLVSNLQSSNIQVQNGQKYNNKHYQSLVPTQENLKLLTNQSNEMELSPLKNQKLIKSEDEGKSSRPRSIYQATNDAKDEWNLIIKHNTQKYYEELDEKKRKQRQQYIEFQKSLDLQVQEKEKKKLEEKTKEFEHHNDIMKSIQTFDDKVNQKQIRQIQHNKKLQEYREQQINNQKLKNKTKLIESKEFEKQYISQVKENLVKDKDNIEKKKQIQREYLRKLKQQYDEDKQRAKEQLKILNMEDQKIFRDYEQLQETYEKRKFEDQIKRDNQYQTIQQMINPQKLKQAYLQQQIDLENENIRRQFEQKNELERQQLQDQAYRQKQLKQEMKEILDIQMQEKERQKQHELLIKQKYSNLINRDVESYIQQQKFNQEKKIQENQRHADELKEQIIKDNIRKKAPVVMSTEELLHNKIALKELTQSNENLSHYVQRSVVLPKIQSVRQQ